MTDGINPISLSDQSGLISNQMTLVQRIQVESGNVVQAQSFGLYNALAGAQPIFWTRIVRNNTNTALGATAGGHVCLYSTLTYSTPVPIVYANWAGLSGRNYDEQNLIASLLAAL